MTIKERKETKEKLFDYMKYFMSDNEWYDEHISEQARAFFTTLCFVGDVIVDTDECDNILERLYYETNVSNNDFGYDEFVEFMIEFIV